MIEKPEKAIYAVGPIVRHNRPTWKVWVDGVPEEPERTHYDYGECIRSFYMLRRKYPDIEGYFDATPTESYTVTLADIYV